MTQDTEFNQFCFKSFFRKAFSIINPEQRLDDNWHIDLLLSHLELAKSEKIKRLLVNIPPRCLKSSLISIAWPAWLLSQNPSKKIIVASYSKALSLKLSEDCKLVMESEWYKSNFPNTKIRKGANRKDKFITTLGGFRYATSVGGTLTGEGADYLIVDDPQTPLQALSSAKRSLVNNWYDQTFSTRLNDKKKGVILVIMQRLHNEDLSSHLLQKGNFHHLKLPMVSEASEEIPLKNYKIRRNPGDFLISNREGESEVQTAKKELGCYGFNSQYQQTPDSINNAIIKRSWIQRYEKIPESGTRYQSWDTAIKVGQNNDYSACTSWIIADGYYYLDYVTRIKLEFSPLKNLILEHAQRSEPTAILIEDKASGQQLIQELKKSPHNIIPYRPTQDKISKLISISLAFESGKVFLPNKAAWLDEFESELFNFPNGKHDDQVDSMSQFINWHEKRNRNVKIRIC